MPKSSSLVLSDRRILEVLEQHGAPITVPQLAQQMALSGSHKNKLQAHIKALAERGVVHINKQFQVVLVKANTILPGRVVGHRDGFGFVIFSSTQPDGYLSVEEMHKVMHGDRVLARIVGSDHRGRPIAEITEVTERARTKIAGELKQTQGLWVVEPDHPRIRHRVLIKASELHGATAGDRVVALITEPPSEHGEVRGRIEKILTSSGVTLLTEMAIATHGLPYEFPAAVRRQARRIPATVDERILQDEPHRRDWRAKAFVTIDGEDARDFDDAVLAEKLADGYRLWVAIADVSHYVVDGSALDQEALNRSTSVYFPDRVVPMLPEELSNNLCSLNPRVDRAVLGVELTIGFDGRLTDYQFAKALIHSKARLTYTQVGAWLSAGFGDAAIDPSVKQSLTVLHELYGVLAQARHARGALEFNAPETKLKLDEHGEVVDVVMIHRNDAHKLIEECMITANVAAAKYLASKKMPCLYRVHGTPSDEKIAELQNMLMTRQIPWRWQSPITPHQLTDLMRSVRDRSDLSVIETQVVRSLPQAVYQPDNIGHFGLSLSHYAHFTSPIRRYPDLLVHRAIGHCLQGLGPDTFDYSHADMDQFGELTSQHERRADDATRDVVSGLKCRWLSKRVGQDFDAVVSSVVEFGLFVQIEPYAIDGLIHISSLGREYFDFIADRLELRGSQSGRRFGLGDRLRVQVVRVDERDRKVDVMLAEDAGGNGSDRAPSRHRRYAPSANDRRSRAGDRSAKASGAPSKARSQSKPTGAGQTASSSRAKPATPASAAKAKRGGAPKGAGAHPQATRSPSARPHSGKKSKSAARPSTPRAHKRRGGKKR